MALKKGQAKQTRLSIEERVKILERLDKGEKSVVLAQEYKVSTSAIANMKKYKENLIKQRSSLLMCQGKTSKKRCTGVENSRLDQSLFEWFQQEKSMGKRVTGPMIQKKALELNKILNGPENFKASTGFLSKFKERHNINLSVRGEKDPIEQDANNTLCQELTDNNMEILKWEILNDQEVALPEHYENIDHEEAVENNEHVDDCNTVNDSSAKNAFDAIDTFMSWYYTRNHCSSEDLQYLWKFWKYSLNQTLIKKDKINIC